MDENLKVEFQIAEKLKGRIPNERKFLVKSTLLLYRIGEWLRTNGRKPAVPISNYREY